MAGNSGKAPLWNFRRYFRRSAYSWRGSRLAIERIVDAVAEIKKAAKDDPILGATGAVLFLERVSPALDRVDDSSGTLGATTTWAVEELAKIIGVAPAPEPMRQKWLERLWVAYGKDDPPYIAYLGDVWGGLCASREIATEWVDRLELAVIGSFQGEIGERRYFAGESNYFSALFAAGDFEETLAMLERAPAWWHYRRWGFRALVAMGKRAEALRYAEASRGERNRDGLAISIACERLLLDSGMAEEAYNRYAIAASPEETTYLARYRALAKKYPWKAPADLLRDLIADTPGRESKWFAAAKSVGLFDEAIALAKSAPCDPKTLTRAARDFVEKRPAFAYDVALLALRWLAAGCGYEVTNLDVLDAYRYGSEAARRLDREHDYKEHVNALVAEGDTFFRKSLSEYVRMPG